ncbi:MAG: porin, partial [Myxococcaceae bacterium]
MIDPARVLEFRDRTLGEATVKQPVGPVSMFQDFYVTYKTTYVEASVGQFKIPVSWEGYNSSSKLLFAERDLGIRLAKKFERFGYMAGVY